jgi:tRNA uridine 5-carboxymethylaminomethyl modification enzyme
MTSRSEYRLYLRQDNADLRLTPIGREIGLISDERYEKFLKKKEMIENETERVRRKTIAPEKGINEYLVQKGTAPLSTGIKEAELIKRPQLKYSDVMKFDNEAPDVPRDVAEQVEITLKYEGYIKMQLAEIKEMRRLENKIIPENTDYSDIGSLRKEAREKLLKIRPETLGQASRISGVSPADISVLAVYLSRKGK